MEAIGEYYAHSSGDRKEPLLKHLQETGRLAAKFAASFGYEKLGLQLGLLHDVGKRTERFQMVLRHQLSKIDHAVVAAECYADLADACICNDDYIYLMICHCLNAHHSKLRGDFKDIGLDEIYPLPISFDMPDISQEGMQKLNALSSMDEFHEIEKYIEDQCLIVPLSENDYPDMEVMTNAERMLFARMLQSCLVDADYSATASFEDPAYAEGIEEQPFVPGRLLQQLEAYHETLVSTSDPHNLMNQLRNKVYLDAAEAGKRNTGIFTLTAPTGTAKTLAMMRFALEHALHNKKSRIIIVLPYLAITTQNTQIYRSVFGAASVLEDDSMTEYPDEARIYADRWNSPIVVTTSVKFFETLQASQASDLRRLHQIANSIVIFDESQTLPSDMTDITMKTLRALTKYFKTTILLSTATQPSYRYRRGLVDFYTNEIIRDTDRLYHEYAEAKKTSVYFSVNQEWTEKDIAIYLGEISKQALCVSNTTNKALMLYKAFAETYGEKNTLYLSSRLCPEHKKTVVNEVKRRLKTDATCYLLSTQCIEAGVDLDFPVGAREYASMTSVSQTAGRINRNGKRTNAQMLVFKSNQNGAYDYPSDSYRNEADITYHMASDHMRESPLDTNSLEDIDEYYRRLYSGDSSDGHDKRGIIDAENECDILKMSEEYHLIADTNQCHVFVPYEPCMNEFEQLSELLLNQNYTLKKKELYAHHGITVSVVATGKSLDFIRSHCHQICLYSPFQNVPINWYIADMDDIYDPKTGLRTKEKLEEGGMMDV